MGARHTRTCCSEYLGYHVLSVVNAQQVAIMYGRFGAMWARDVTQRSLRIRVHPFLKPRSSSSQAVLPGWHLLCACVHYYLFAVARFSDDFDTQQFSTGGLVWKVSVVFDALHIGVVLPSEPLP